LRPSKEYGELKREWPVEGIPWLILRAEDEFCPSMILQKKFFDWFSAMKKPGGRNHPVEKGPPWEV
jgi:hypothetical protein